MLDKTLIAERELGVFAQKLIIYKYKVYSATTILLLILSITTLVLSVFEVLEYFNLIIFVAIFALPFTVALIMVKIFGKSLMLFDNMVLARGSKIDNRRIHATFALSYTIPIVAAYLVNPLPYWPIYAWYIALLFSNLMVTIFYEQYINSLLPQLKIRIYFTLTLVSLLLTPILAYSIIAFPRRAGIVGIILYMVASIISSIQEIYRAEKML